MCPSQSIWTLHFFFSSSHAVSILLADSANSVKQALMEHSVTKLAVFFGKQKANDVILSHMITFLNDKEDSQVKKPGKLIKINSWQVTFWNVHNSYFSCDCHFMTTLLELLLLWVSSAPPFYCHCYNKDCQTLKNLS